MAKVLGSCPHNIRQTTIQLENETDELGARALGLDRPIYVNKGPEARQLAQAITAKGLELMRASSHP